MSHHWWRLWQFWLIFIYLSFSVLAVKIHKFFFYKNRNIFLHRIQYFLDSFWRWWAITMFPPQCSFVEVGSWQFKLFWRNVQSKAKHSLFSPLQWSRWGVRWQDYIWSCKTVHANHAFMAQALLWVEFWNWEDLDYF